MAKQALTFKDDAIKALKRKQMWDKLQGYELSGISVTMINDLSLFDKYVD